MLVNYDNLYLSVQYVAAAIICSELSGESVMKMKQQSVLWKGMNKGCREQHAYVIGILCWL